MVQMISVPQAAQLLRQGGAQAVDVRRREEYAAGHIPGAVLLPLNTLTRNAVQQLPDRDALLLVYCRSGSRARTACELLERLGYRRVRDLGGLLGWPYPLEIGCPLGGRTKNLE